VEFTFSFYKQILSEVRQNLVFDSFFEEKGIKQVFLRHDVDIYPENIRNFCEVEAELGVRSIFFFQPNNDFYNLLSKQVTGLILEIVEQGFQIGLHIDASYLITHEEVNEEVFRFFNFYSGFFPLKKIISFHRPPQRILSNLQIPGFINTYEDRFFKNIRYFSDSNRRNFYSELRESLQQDHETNLQLLIHPYWWDFEHLDVGSLFSRLLETKRRSFERSLSDNTLSYKRYYAGR